MNFLEFLTLWYRVPESREGVARRRISMGEIVSFQHGSWKLQSLRLGEVGKPNSVVDAVVEITGSRKRTVWTCSRLVLKLEGMNFEEYERLLMGLPQEPSFMPLGPAYHPLLGGYHYLLSPDDVFSEGKYSAREIISLSGDAVCIFTTLLGVNAFLPRGVAAA